MTQSLLSLEQAAAQLGYSASGLRKLIRAGRGPRYTRPGGRGHFRFHPDWLAEYVEQAASPAPKKRQAPPVESRFGLNARL